MQVSGHFIIKINVDLFVYACALGCQLLQSVITFFVFEMKMYSVCKFVTK